MSCFSFLLPILFLHDFCLQPSLVTTSVSATSKPAHCLVRWKRLVKLCAYGSRLCRLGTNTFHSLTSGFVIWNTPCVRAGRREENRGCCNASRHRVNAHSVTIINWGMRMARCAEAVGCIRVTWGRSLFQLPPPPSLPPTSPAHRNTRP